MIVERQDANFQAYDSPVTARMLLGGTVDPPDWALPLIKTLEACTGMPGGREWINDGTAGIGRTAYAFGGTASPSPSPSPSPRVNMPSFLQKKKKPDVPPFPPPSWQLDNQSDSSFSTTAHQSHSRNHTWDGGDYLFYGTPKNSSLVSQYKPSKSADKSLVSTNASFESLMNPFVPSTNPFSRKSSMYTNEGFSTAPTSDTLPEKNYPVRSPKPFVKPREELARPLLSHEGIARAVAVYDFNAVEVANPLCSCLIVH